MHPEKAEPKYRGSEHAETVIGVENWKQNVWKHDRNCQQKSLR